jgi:hypothetical protein
MIEFLKSNDMKLRNLLHISEKDIHLVLRNKNSFNKKENRMEWDCSVFLKYNPIPVILIN